MNDTSAARVEANRQNAMKSTGPKTQEGKDKVRLNGLKHGLRARLPVLPGEDPDEIEAQRAAWIDDLKPNGPVETTLVEEALAAATGLERCRRQEAAALRDWFATGQQARRRAALEDVETHTARLAERPAAACAGLADTFEGCVWVRQRWERLRDVLDEDGAWDLAHLTLALQLSGVKPTEIGDDPDGHRLTRLVLACGPESSRDLATLTVRLASFQPADLSRPDSQRRLSNLTRDLPPADEARATLRARAERERQAWSERADVQAAADARHAAGAADLVAVDDSPEGLLRLRYIQMHQRALRQTLADLRALQEARPVDNRQAEADEPLAPSKANEVTFETAETQAEDDDGNASDDLTESTAAVAWNPGPPWGAPIAADRRAEQSQPAGDDPDESDAPRPVESASQAG